MTDKDAIKNMEKYGEEEEEEASGRRRRKRFDWGDIDWGGGGSSKTDYSKTGIGALNKRFVSLMVGIWICHVGNVK